MTNTFVQVVNVPIQWVNCASWDNPHSLIMGGFRIEVEIVDTDMTLEEARLHLEDGTRFRLVKEPT